MSLTLFAEFTRPNGELVTVEYGRSRFYSATGPSWNDPGSPSEGGEAEIIKAHTEADGWNAKWSDEEDQKWTNWIHENRPADELEADPYEYDNWEDR